MKMSNVAKTKSRDKKVVVVNDSHKTTPTKASSIGGAYNPLLVESSSSSSLHTTGRFRSIDESDDCDSVSNNGSWSGDSEDHKEKTTAAPPSAKQEATIDNEKREKMRLKNERKHQRQKEKRAQELHERCCQFLMSRKLEVLTQKIIAMEIPHHEKATYALMLNEGKLEESVNWLLDVGGASVEDKKLDPSFGSLKIDISEELGRILELEAKYKWSKQDVERAVVTAEGDVERAEESLRRQKQDHSVKVEDVSSNNSKVPEEERKNVNQSVNPMDKINMNLQLMKNAAMEEKKRMSNQQPPPPRPMEETHHVTVAIGREPVMVMQQQQRSQSANTNVPPVSTMNPSFTVSAGGGGGGGGGGSGWYPANGQTNGYLPVRTPPPSDLNSNLMYQYQQYQGNNGHIMGRPSEQPHAVAPAASLGLFSGYGSASSSGIDWSADGSVGKYDYSKIDWSLDRGLACPRQEEQQQYVAEASQYEADMSGRTRMNGNGMGVQEVALVGNGGREWTSPFEGKDLFGLSRQYVPPSL
ncbi:unnamed protein product [Brassica rapa]|uniref:UBA domain-containing protein n=1 Tax=Brassica campestris TaxID=3711 RepID=A0A8D9H2H9_BRACM|nr:unnamed protein product [Brassica rapa]